MSEAGSGTPVERRADLVLDGGGVKGVALAGAAHDWRNVDEPSVRSRTIFVDTGEVEATDFGIDEETRTKMLESADQATRDFLSRWDFADYRRRHRGES